MRDVYIIGVGMTKFGKFRDINVIDLGRIACWEAIKDCNIDPKEIEVGYCGHARTGMLHGRECGVGQSILAELGIGGIPITSVGNFCASGSSAFREAWLAVGSEMYEVAIAIGVEQLSKRKTTGQPLTPDGLELQAEMGFTAPAFYAQAAFKHMELYGTTLEQLAKVSVKNRKNACLNPRAQYQKEVTVEEVLNSKMIVEPLTLLSCCPTGDGGAAAILCSEKIAKKYPEKAVKICVAGLASGSAFSKDSECTTVDVVVNLAKEAYEYAGIGPEDLDVAEVHDCFNIAEIMHYEDLGLCEKGQGGKIIEEGKTEIGGIIPINTSGGLISKGHPLGATGIAQVAEITWQLRGEAGKRQLENAKVGLAECGGGFQERLVLGDIQSFTIIILSK